MENSHFSSLSLDCFSYTRAPTLKLARSYDRCPWWNCVSMQKRSAVVINMESITLKKGHGAM